MNKGILKSIIAVSVVFAIFLTVFAAYAQDDMQEAKASFLGAGVKFKMDRPSMKARNLESANSEQVKEAKDFRHMDNGLLSGAFGGGSEGVRSRPIKDTKIVCEVCKAKAVLNASENCDFCKGKSYADLCDKCIAWSILNSCEKCKANIRGKVGKKETVTETASDASLETPAEIPAEVISADEATEEKVIEKPKAKKKTAKKAKTGAKAKSK
jgi:hypothetical protein